MKKYDVLIIGGGPGGYVAAIKAAQMKKSCALVEKDNLGGTCLNWGCIPTKSLLRNAEAVSLLNQGETYGFSFDCSSVKTDYEKAFTRSREVSSRLRQGIEYLMKKNGIDVYKDEAVFTAPKSVRLKKSKQTLEAENVIIATGSRPKRLNGVDYLSEYILDSKRALQLRHNPKSVVIVGAGPIGMEFATIWNAYGSDVTIVELMPRVLPNEDEEISKEAEKLYKKNGIKILTDAKVEEVITKGHKSIVNLDTLEGKTTIECEYLLVSVGILPNSDSIGIEKTGVKIDKQGYILVDDMMRTNVAGIYAIGDVTGKMALAHAASAQGIIAAKQIAGQEAEPIIYENVPKCTYGKPEVASVGITERQAKEKGYDINIGVFPFAANGKAIAGGETEGFVKIIANARYGEILGIHMIGSHVTEMISGAVGYLSLECTLDELSSFICPHPTMSEVLMEAAHVALGYGIHI